MPPLVLVSAAEPSGDRLGAALVSALRARGPVVVRGVAGPAMRAAGVEPLFEAERLGVMGVAEVFTRLSALRRARQALDAALPGADALVCIDAPDLHLPLARRARARGVPTIGYVAPQVWAWRPGRVATIRSSLDRLLCLFSFEPPLFPGLDARWVGHPAVDTARPRDPQQVDPELFALLPGSRRQELARHLPLFLATAERARARRAAQGRSTRFRLVLPPELGPPPGLPPWVEAASGLEAVAHAAAALTKSGTVTLELAVFGVPQLVAHRVHPLTWLLGRLLVRGVQHIALPNILAVRAGLRAPLPEHIQASNPDKLAHDLLALPSRQDVPLDALGPPGQASRAAAAVAELWER